MKNRKIIRLKGYDYSKAGMYFVTIEPNNRRYSFCKISNGKTLLNEIGKIIEEQWKWIFSRYDHIKMDEYIIMPDHMHGIIRILPDPQLNGKKKSPHDSQLDVRATLESPSKIYRAGPDPPFPLREALEPPVHPDHFRRLSLSHIIGAFKTTASKKIHQAGYQNFKWKRSFHDRILRDDELEIKRNYIKNNPKNWKK